MTLPAILAAGALVFFLGFELFGLPLVLEEPQGVLVLSTYLFQLASRPGVPPHQLMAVTVVTIIVITAPLLLMQRALIAGDLKLIARKPKDGDVKFELFDLSVDPHEQKNLAGQGDPREAKIAAAFDRMLETFAAIAPAAERVIRPINALGYVGGNSSSLPPLPELRHR